MGWVFSNAYLLDVVPTKSLSFKSREREAGVPETKQTGKKQSTCPPGRHCPEIQQPAGQDSLADHLQDRPRGTGCDRGRDAVGQASHPIGGEGAASPATGRWGRLRTGRRGGHGSLWKNSAKELDVEPDSQCDHSLGRGDFRGVGFLSEKTEPALPSPSVTRKWKPLPAFIKGLRNRPSWPALGT